MRYLFLGMLLFCLNFSTKAQTTEVIGVVKDRQTKETLVGVSVGVKGGTAGVLTDANGVFKIKVSNPNSAVLIFRYIGYKSQEIQLGGNKQLDVFLEIQNVMLNEVVSIGYTTVNRRDVSGSISSVGERQLRDIPISSVEQALTGRLAGVQVSTSEGTPDAEVKIRIRGGNSITQDGGPIYIIDGVQVEEGMKGLAVQDIESIDVLKDASSASIYGARGANGVVIITTKKGAIGKTKVSYNPIMGINKVANTLNVMSPYEFVLFQRELSRYNNITTDSLNFINRYGTDLSVYQSEPSIDWQDLMFGRSAFQNTQNIGLSAGNKDTRINLGYTYNNQEGAMLKSNYNRHLVNVKLDHTINSKFKVGTNVRYSKEKVMGAGVSNSGSVTYNLLRNVIRYQPFLVGSEKDIDEFDQEYFDLVGNTNFTLVNPIALNNAKESDRFNELTSITAYLDYKINKDISFKSTLGYTVYNQDRRTFDGEITPLARANGDKKSMIGFIDNKRLTINNSNVLSYNKTFAKKHKLNFLLGEETYQLKNNYSETRLRYFPEGMPANKAFNMIQLGTVQEKYPTSEAYESAILSFFTRANYSYNNKYVLTASLRTDGSSKFHPDNRWGYFPSASLAWKVSQENFMKGVRVIEDIKLRASYGTSGNNRIADYLYFSSYSAASNVYSLGGEAVNGFVLNELENKNLRWEKTRSTNLGLDFFVFKGLSVSVDAYYNKTTDLLVNVPIPVVSGYIQQLQNVAHTSSKGVEFQFGGTPMRNKNFTWTSDFNLSINRNKVDKISQYQKQVLFSSGIFAAEDYILKVGEPIGLMYGYVEDGFYKVDDYDYNPVTQYYTLKPGIINSETGTGKSQPGSMKIKDVNGDGVISDADKQIIGNANPKFTGGFSNQFKYKSFDLSVFVNFVYGNNILNASKVEFTNAYSKYSNVLDVMNNRWRTIDENGNSVQKLIGTNIWGAAPEVLAALNENATIWKAPTESISSTSLTSWAIEDGSFLRLNNITLGYTLPSQIVKRYKIQNLRVFATAHNLGLWTNYTGYDPEVDTRRSVPTTPGVDYSAYPRSKSFVFGLNLTL